MLCRAGHRPADEILAMGMISLKVEPQLLALSGRFSRADVRNDVSTDSSHKGSVMKLIKTTLVISALLFHLGNGHRQNRRWRGSGRCHWRGHRQRSEIHRRRCRCWRRYRCHVQNGEKVKTHVRGCRGCRRWRRSGCRDGQECAERSGRGCGHGCTDWRSDPLISIAGQRCVCPATALFNNPPAKSLVLRSAF